VVSLVDLADYSEIGVSLKEEISYLGDLRIILFVHRSLIADLLLVCADFQLLLYLS
jgi:hypothetical protein